VIPAGVGQLDRVADDLARGALGVPRADLQSVLAQTCDELALVPTRPSTRPHDPPKPLPARPLRVLAPSLGLRGHNECQRSRDPVRRQWAGVTITAAGLAVIGLTATSEGPQRSSLAALIVAETAILAIGVGLVRISTPRDVEHRGEALLLATAAGVLYGVSDVAIKYLTHAHEPVYGLLSPWTLTALISFVTSFCASARSLQIGLAIEVIAITSGGGQPLRDPRRHPCLRRADRLRRRWDNRPSARVRPRYRGRGARARTAALHL
jgi:hypothetical protein